MTTRVLIPGGAQPELTCRDATDFLDAYLDNELGAGERLRFDEHLAECPDCRTYLRQYAETIALAKDACGDEAALDAGIPESLVEAILASVGPA